MLSIRILHGLAVCCLFIYSKAASVPNQIQGPGFISTNFRVDSDARNLTKIKQKKRDKILTGSLESSPGFYYIDVYAGSNKQKNSLLIDTGSSYLWFFDKSIADQEQVFKSFYDPSSSSSSKILSDDFGDGYGASQIHGNWVQDDISLSPNGPAISTFFGDVTSIKDISVGILGLGFSHNDYPNYPELLASNSLISKNAYSLYLGPAASDSGTVIFGGVDYAKHSGEFVTFPVSSESDHLAINVDSFVIHGKQYKLNTDAILDSGSTLIELPGNVVDQLNQDIFNGKGVQNSLYLFEMKGPCPNFGDLKVDFGKIKINVPQEDYLRYNGETCELLTIKQNSGVILGDTFLRHAYTVFSLADSTISIAQVKHTSESNVKPIGIDDFSNSE